jgi:lipoprotein Spr
MVKQILPAIAFIIFLSSCSSLKSLSFTNHKKIEPETSVTRVNFLDEITVKPEPAAIDQTAAKPESRVVSKDKPAPPPVKKSNAIEEILAARAESSLEKSSPVELKYSVLLDTEVEYLPTRQLLETVDDWYGVRYRTGGNTKKGVDCSGFTVAVYATLYGFALPRVSREQYRVSRKISTTELKEGDLVFFDTRGGGYVSHVGVYLGNNKFIHASVSRGVMVNDLFESYYVKRYVGAGRIDSKFVAGSGNASSALKP